MLDKPTKTIINNARDILVGKVPNPQSQVDLITIAMIYKFMDDMDKQNMELGGNRVFFTDDLEQYAWSKLLAPKHNNWDRLALYSKALDKLQIAKQIPELFRKIFKGAFLPFRDGATLTMFLKEIDYFSYDNSENLGNAFEYLLSIMGSQGDAGQFRTPRHIIDFIVDVVNPTKTDTILDPACGTAGFLISAYKHILEHAKKANKPLIPTQMKTLTDNIVGYDISPDMVKLASVNLFLHQFPTPKIYEYDTLSSDDRWTDKFDVILANPPFMTPKGGIQPHSKFGIKANRAEVLFVDYMMEHLNLKGKAGFVVPEGIIFQSATAYKDLRKMMVEDNYLYAVVSLPSGVFNPYSGVKTSILLFDRELAKKTKDILFVKVDNDGYDLGAQRREIKDNDLPRATELLKAYQENLKSGNAFDISKYTKCLLVSKDEIKENGEYNLTVSRYEKATDYSQCQYEMVKLGDVCELKRGQGITKNQIVEGDIPVIAGGQQPAYYHNEYNRMGEIITVSGSGAYAGYISYFNQPIFVSDAFTIRPHNESNILTKFLYRLLKSIQEDIYRMRSGAGIPHVYPKDFINLQIPLPPLSVQEEIVTELDQYQAIIDGAQKVVDNWKPTIEINPEWEKVKLGDEKYFRIEAGGTPSSTETSYWNGDIKWVTLVDLPTDNNVTFIENTERTITKSGLKNSSAKLLPTNSILVSSRATIGRIAINKVEVATNQGFKNLIIQDFNKINPVFVANMLKHIVPQMLALASGGTFKEISKTSFSTLEIPLPPLPEQIYFATKWNTEEMFIQDLKKLIEINKQKIADRIKSIWSCGNE